MSKRISCDVHLDDKAILAKLDRVISNDVTMLELNQLLARYCDPYVPFLEGVLAQTLSITPQGVTYHSPYAHYQYFLHDMNEDLAGTTNRTRIRHPLATSYWDKAMMQQQGDSFLKEVQAVIDRRLKQENG